MKINVVMGFFLPMPPVAGGAVEKSWHSLSRELARRGHEVTLISRSWQNWPVREICHGVTHLRIPGFDHSRFLVINLIRDFLWSMRVHRKLPPADIVVVNTISLACWLGALRRKAGKVVVMLGRMPKGQFRLYRQLARIYVPSTPVREAVEAEASRYSSIIRVIGYPINWTALANATSVENNRPVTLGFIGRIHREKGLDLLVDALQALSKLPLPTWQAVICGPHDIHRGGSGAEYLAELRRKAPPQVEFSPPLFDEAVLHQLYGRLDIFCYPSLAAHGETFGVAVAEAMAVGAVPVVSNLPCFTDFVKDGINGFVFDPLPPDASDRLATLLADLIRDTTRLRAMGTAASRTVSRYDLTNFTDMLEADFTQLTTNTVSASM